MTNQEKIDKILEIIDLDFNDFAMECKIIPNSLKAAIRRDTITEDLVTKIHDRFGVRKGFFKDGKEPVIDKNITQVQDGSDNKENPLGVRRANVFEELYEKFLGSNSDYLVIHKDMLKDHRLISVERLDEDKERALNDRADREQRSNEIQTLTAALREIAMRPINIQLPEIKRTQE